MKDKAVDKLIKLEAKRQKNVINLIASENYVSRDVRMALGSIFTNKYAEGYSELRYYGGNEFVDRLESLACERALGLFNLSPKKWSVNVQPYSGSPANLAVYLALVPLGERIMGMQLDMGGHLTHGHAVSATGKLWEQVPYVVDKKTEKLDYKKLMKIAREKKPRAVVCGFTAYSRIVDFKKFRAVADAAGAYLIADISHFAGLVAGSVYHSPFPYADVVTTTTHKTLRGPRSAIIFSKHDLSRGIDKMVFPGLQGGPHANKIAAVAAALLEAGKPSFKKYARQVVKNAGVLSSELAKRGWRIVSGGTDTHLFLVDTWRRGIRGRVASDMLEVSGIIVNKNAIPYDERNPMDPSGIRIGTPAVTTRGMKEKEMKIIAGLIDGALVGGVEKRIAREVLKLTRLFPVP